MQQRVSTAKKTITIFLLTVALTAGCSFGQDEPPQAQLLTATIAPCAPIAGASIDPCSQAASLETPSLALTSSSPFDDPPTLKEHMRPDLPEASTHIIARATFLPNTTRCTLSPWTPYPHWLAETEFTAEVAAEKHYMWCFTDARVNEYIVGDGPDRLQIAVYGIGFEPWEFRDDGHKETVLNHWAGEFGSRHEGVERVLMLAPS